MKYLPLEVKTDKLSCTWFSGDQADIQIVNGDTILLLGKFLKQNYSTGLYEAMDFTADGGNPAALRCTVRQTRNPSDELMTFQDAYNQGDFVAAFEDLTAGQVSWLLSFNDSDIDQAFTDAGTDTIQVWLEITYLDNGSLAPTTLLQKQITIVQQLDNGAVGTPPPTSPTYLTATEIDALYPKWAEIGYWPNVIDKDLTAPPGGESTGDTYIVGAGATGDWSGHDGKIAVYQSSSYTFYTPQEGWTAWLNDDDTFYTYESAAWGVKIVQTAGTLSTEDILTSIDSAGKLQESLIKDGVAAGILTLAKAGTTARTVTFPDRALSVAGVSGANTSQTLPKFDANGDLTDSLIAQGSITGLLTLAKAGTTARTATFPDAAIVVAGSASALTSTRVPFVTTGGLLTDSTNLTFDGSNLTVGGYATINSLYVGQRTGTRATAVGEAAASAASIGSDWIAFGYKAGQNATGNKWFAGGYQAGYQCTGSDWFALGYGAGQGNISGGQWFALGRSAATQATGGGFVSIGYLSAFGNTSGSSWTAIGGNVAYNLAAGSSWLAVGYQAARYKTGGGNLTAVDNSTYIGTNTTGTEGATNENVFGYYALGAGSNTVTIGNASITNNYFSGNVQALSTAGAQFTAAYTAGAVETTMTTNSSGYFAIDPSGGLVTIDGDLTVIAGGSPSFHGDTAFGIGNTTGAASSSQMEFLNGTTGSANIWFSDTAAAARGRIVYDHTADSLAFYTASNLALTINSSRYVGIGTASIAAQLHVDQSSTSGAIPVLTLDQADVDEPILKVIGTAAGGSITNSLVAVADVGTFTPAGFMKIEVQDDGNQITDQDYYVQFGTLAS